MKLILTIFSLFLATTFFAQDYIFTHFNEQYIEFSDGIEFDVDSICNDPELVEFHLGFDFPYFNFTFQKIAAHPLFLYSLSSISENLNENITAQLIPFGVSASCRDEGNGVTSNISHKTEGQIGDRICKIQWSNLSLFNSTQEDYINYQAWLYENGTIEFRIGGLQLSSNACYWDGEIGGLSTVTVYDENNGEPLNNSIFLSGNPANPNTTIGINPVTLVGHPDSSMVYRFSRTDAGIKKTETAKHFEVYPNPSKDKINISKLEEIKSIQIKDISGKTIFSPVNFKDIDISVLESGSYLIEIVDTKNNVSFSQFVKN